MRRLAFCKPHVVLIADRFISINGRSIDLATGEAVEIRKPPLGDEETELAWDERCAAAVLAGRHRGTPTAVGARGVLIDYGLLNDGRRFEAFRLRGRARAEATPCFASQGASPSADGLPAISNLRRGATARRTVRAQTAWLGEQVADVFASACYGEPRRIIWRAAGGRQDGIVDFVARSARLAGFVPVCLDLLVNADRTRNALGALVRQVVRTRHVLMIARDAFRCDRRGWCSPRGRLVSPCVAAVAQAVLQAGMCSARPNVLFVVTTAGESSRVLPQCLAARLAAGGSLRAGAASRLRPRVVRATIAADGRESYRALATSDLGRARTRAASAIADAQRACSARAEYALREAIGALSRREDTAGAAWASLNLGCVLLYRGRALEAARTFEQARAQFDRIRDLHGTLRAAIYTGLAWTDDGRLREAEAAFRSSAIAADQVGLHDLRMDANLGLARCLYWQGRFDEACVVMSSLSDVVERSEERPAADGGGGSALYPIVPVDRQISLVREAQADESWGAESGSVLFHGRVAAADGGNRMVRMAALSARIALAQADVRGAAAHATRALERARRTGQPLDACTAHIASASVYGALTDIATFLVHLRDGLAAARRAHAPLLALRLRLAACDTLRRAGREREAAPLLSRLARLSVDRFPVLLRDRLQIVVGKTKQATGGEEARRAVVAACPWRLPPPRPNLAEEIAAVLQTCHETENEEAALARVCDEVRDRARAVAVAVVARNGGGPAVVARSGTGAGRCSLAERVLDTGLPVSAAATPAGLEAAAPIRYAGVVVGAMVARWTADALVDGTRMACMLSAAGAAVAPHVRSVLDRQFATARGSDADDHNMVGVSDAIEAVRRAAFRAAGAPFPVLIEGESGSGKELVARAIHRDSPRRGGRFCALNCAALTDDLVEAELFGHARGAFTGAVTERVGLFEEADGGTLFLDEVADLSPRAQAKLLRAVQDGEVRRIGENFSRKVDTRVVAATNRRLETEVANGGFRRDLFYRLNVVHIDVPPLRDRPEDIHVLAAHFWQRSIARIGSHATLAPATLTALSRYDWPGNVRELQNVMAALAVSAPRRGSVAPTCLPGVIAGACTRAETLEDARQMFERRFVRAALARAGGHRGRTAASLGISRQGLAKLLVRLNLQDSADPDA